MVAVHHGTRESPARLTELGGRYFQLRLEQPIVAARGDRLVIRSLAPPDTIGGGVVLDPAPRRHGPSRDLTARLAAPGAWRDAGGAAHRRRHPSRSRSCRRSASRPSPPPSG